MEGGVLILNSIYFTDKRLFNSPFGGFYVTGVLRFSNFLISFQFYACHSIYPSIPLSSLRAYRGTNGAPSLSVPVANSVCFPLLSYKLGCRLISFILFIISKIYNLIIPILLVFVFCYFSLSSYFRFLCISLIIKKNQ